MFPIFISKSADLYCWKLILLKKNVLSFQFLETLINVCKKEKFLNLILTKKQNLLGNRRLFDAFTECDGDINECVINSR